MDHSHHVAGHSQAVTERFPVTNLYCVCCADALESTLKANPHIQRVKVDFLQNTVDVTYHSSMISPAEIERLIAESGRCTPADIPAADMTHANHQAQMAPVTMGTKHDRMQYEFPSTAAHAEHEHGHHEAKSHGGMDHDMSDPRMAKAM
jgi:copper chaperone CopZ